MISPKTLLLLLVTLLVISYSSCEDSTEQDALNSNVVVLDSSNFDSVIAENPFVLVEVYAPWCGHCKHLAPHYEEAANTLKAQNSAVILAKLDGAQDSERALVSKLGVRGFPTLIFYSNGAPTPYTGQRTAEDIVSWVTKKSGPTTISLKDVASYDEYLTSNPAVSIVGYFTNGSEAFQAFSVASRHPNYESMNFAVVTDEAVATHGGLSLNQVTIKRSFDEPATFDFTNVADLQSFLNKNVHPYLEPAQTSWARLREQGLPIGIFIYDEKDESSSDSVKAVTDVAKTLSGTFGFASVPADYLEKSVQLGASGKKLPTLVVVSPSQLNYPYSDDAEFTKEAIETWARGILSGSVKPNFKSEPVPETQEGPVFKLVGSQFEEVVLNSSKSVFIEFYAPWCGHCKSLEPTWQQLAEHYEGNDNVVIAKLDSTLNDNPVVAVSGYPTIYLFVAGNSTPLEYNGGRDLESLISFVDTNVPTAAETKSETHEEL